MPAGPHAIIGREAELRHLGELVDGIDDGPVALLLEGEIGIGKTRLWDEGVSAARSGSRRVLVCRPSGSEAQLAYAALGDLLAEVPNTAMAGLPRPQRRIREHRGTPTPKEHENDQRACSREGKRPAPGARSDRRPPAPPRPPPRRPASRRPGRPGPAGLAGGTARPVSLTTPVGPPR
jgi:hypothetical protein